MPTKTGKTYAETYPNDLAVSQTSGVGIDSTTRVINDGLGNSTAISLSDDVLSVQPVTHSTTGTLLCKTQGGNNILAVDTTNSKVLVNSGQVTATTQYATFGVHATESTTWVANTHYPIPFVGAGTALTIDTDFGTGTDPDDTFTTANTDTQYASQIVCAMWSLPDNITINSVAHIEGADNSTGDTTRCHLKSFTFNSGATGCLTGGTLLAHNTDITNGGNEQAYNSAWTIDSADVDRGKVILCFFRSDSVNSDYSLNVTVKYFIR